MAPDHRSDEGPDGSAPPRNPPEVSFWDAPEGQGDRDGALNFACMRGSQNHSARVSGKLVIRANSRWRLADRPGWASVSRRCGGDSLQEAPSAKDAPACPKLRCITVQSQCSHGLCSHPAPGCGFLLGITPDQDSGARRGRQATASQGEMENSLFHRCSKTLDMAGRRVETKLRNNAGTTKTPCHKPSTPQV